MSGNFEGWDVSFHFADAYEDVPRFDFTNQLPGGVQMQHSRVLLGGVGGDYAFGSWLVKSELAVLDGIHFATTGEKTRIDAMLGLEYYGIAESTFALEIVNRHLDDYQGSMKGFPDYAQRDTVETALRWSADWLQARLHSVALALVAGEKAQDGSVLRFSADYDIRDALSFGGGIQIFLKGRGGSALMHPYSPEPVCRERPRLPAPQIQLLKRPCGTAHAPLYPRRPMPRAARAPLPLAAVHFRSLGCPKNQLDTEVMLGALSLSQYAIAERLEDADVAIVNTCAFIESAREESIQAILDVADLRESGRLRALLVTGCMPQRYGDELAKELPEVDAFIGTSQYPNVPEILAEVLAGRSRGLYVEARRTHLYDHTSPRLLIGPGHSAYVKTSEGCDRICSFCAIPGIRGKFQSRTLESLVLECEALAAAGVKEVNLVAQDSDLLGQGSRPGGRSSRACCARSTPSKASPGSACSTSIPRPSATS